jgi:hypothetical protein
MPSAPVKRTSQLCTSSNYALKTLNHVLHWLISVPHLEGLAYRIGLVRNTTSTTLIVQEFWLTLPSHFSLQLYSINRLQWLIREVVVACRWGVVKVKLHTTETCWTS